MSRPTSKEDLLEAAKEELSKIFTLIDSMSEEEQTTTFLFEDRDRNLRDILIHLYEWHQLLLNWVNSNLNGERKPFIPEPYNWKTYGQMNIVFWEKHQGTSLNTSIEMLKESHSNVIQLIEKFSNDELFSKKVYPWTGTTTLGSYCVSATSSHYNWAIKKIKKHIKTYRSSLKA
ncbi:ClbS/DfsB family four-helix bundle protein [Clostridium tertium]|uniref:DinB superfamily protein n=1 Tax=Clostridium tertium TaxID=1559 RepID=A0A6N3FM09_9CLOT